MVGEMDTRRERNVTSGMSRVWDHILCCWAHIDATACMPCCSFRSLSRCLCMQSCENGSSSNRDGGKFLARLARQQCGLAGSDSESEVEGRQDGVGGIGEQPECEPRSDRLPEEISDIKCLFCELIVRSSRAESQRLKELEAMSLWELKRKLLTIGMDISWCGQRRDFLQVLNLAAAVCSESECRELLKLTCARNLGCGHRCRGVRGERSCLPCLEDGCRFSDPCAAQKFFTSGDELCAICMLNPVRQAPAILLACGHIVHFHCSKLKIKLGYPGPEISFGFLDCPVCLQVMRHPALEPFVKGHETLRGRIKEMVKEQLTMEFMTKGKRGKSDDNGLQVEIGEELVTDVMKTYHHYLCSQCAKPYFGGVRNCRAVDEGGADYDLRELKCTHCFAAATGHDRCRVKGHGTDYIEFKCRYCCSVATRFCRGAVHYCSDCHLLREKCMDPKTYMRSCPGPDSCPLGLVHAPNGQEACLGCSLCRMQRQEQKSM